MQKKTAWTQPHGKLKPRTLCCPRCRQKDRAMTTLLAPQLDTAYELRLGDSILGKRKADEALYALKTQFKPQSVGTFKPGSLQLDAQRNQVSRTFRPLIQPEQKPSFLRSSRVVRHPHQEAPEASQDMQKQKLAMGIKIRTFCASWPPACCGTCTSCTGMYLGLPR